MKWNGINEPKSLNLDIPMHPIEMKPMTETATSIAHDINQIKQELQADEPGTSFNPVIPTEQHSAMQSLFAFEQQHQKPNDGFYMNAINNIKMETPLVEMVPASSLNLNLYMEKGKKTGRPKS